MKFLACAILMFSLVACSHASVTKTSPRALEDKTLVEVKGQPHFEFTWKDRSIQVGHGAWKEPKYDSNWNQMYGWGPVVWLTQGKRTRVLDLRKELVSFFVTQVFQDEVSGKIILFIDFGIEGPAAAYRVWLSEDRGETWFEGNALSRPPGTFPPSDLDQLYLDHNGNGTAFFRAEASNLPIDKRGGAPATSDVFFRATTSDGAHSWQVDSNPAFINTLKKEKAVWK